jgi:hypothetical protein
MKRGLIILSAAVLLATYAHADEISGRVVFSTFYTKENLEKMGFTFISKAPGNTVSGNGSPLNLVGEPAKLIIKDASGKIVGLCNAGPDGKFAVQVEGGPFYQIEAKQQGIGLLTRSPTLTQ